MLPSCSLVGLHTKKDLITESRLAYSRGFKSAQAVAARTEYLRQQKELEKPQPKAKGYKIRVPEYTAPDGVSFYSHNKNVQIVTR